MHEILTLQLGHRANYLATHFWNTQESYFTYDNNQALSPVDHDVHFRPGVGTRGEETYTPRTLIYDLKGGFGGLKKWGGLYDQQQLDEGPTHENARSVWNGDVLLHTDPQIVPSDYQKSLDEGDSASGKLSTETVRYWSDFNRVFYHPRSIAQIHDYELGSSLMPFEKWEMGEELFVTMDRDTDLIDRDVRVWVEECDHLQGIQMYTGGDDAWAGFAARYTESLRDEFGKSAIWAWGIEGQPGKGLKAQQLLRTLNTAKMINEMSINASMYIPVSLPATPLPQYVHLNRDSDWHSSALLATAVETITLPSRLRHDAPNRRLLSDLETGLNVNGNQRVAQLQCSISGLDYNPPRSGHTQHRSKLGVLPSSNTAVSKEDETNANHADVDINLSGGTHENLSKLEHTFGALEVTRRESKVVDNLGLDDDKEITCDKQQQRFAGKSIIERFVEEININFVEGYQFHFGFPLLDSFPDIYVHQPEASTVAVHTLLSTTSAVSRRVKYLQKQTGRVAKLDGRESLWNGLGEISEEYEEGWQSGSAEDSDG